MSTATTVTIVNRGRGPQLSTTRITVMDVFYWVHRGYGVDEIRDIMPMLSQEEIDAVMDYINANRDELAERDRCVEEIQTKRIAEQHARGGIFAPPDENIPFEERLKHLRARLDRKIAEKNGEQNPG